MTFETKIQIEAMKVLENGMCKPSFAEDENSVYLTTKGYYAYRIPKEQFYLNCDFLNRGDHLASNFSPTMLDHACELTVTDVMREMGKGRIVRKLQCANFDTYIDLNYLKAILIKGCKMYAKNEKSAILFANGGGIYAVCMPVNLKKAD